MYDILLIQQNIISGDIMKNFLTLNKKLKCNNFKDILINLFTFFIVYAFLGYLYEEILFLIEDNILVNRGFLWGPWLPIYGFGGLFIILIFYRYKDKDLYIGKINFRPALLFLETFLLSMAVELISTYVMDMVHFDFKTLWDYSDDLFNFQGRIALIPDLKFGILALTGIYFVQPVLNKIVNNKGKWFNIVFSIILILFLIDLISRIWLGSNFKGLKEVIIFFIYYL